MQNYSQAIRELLYQKPDLCEYFAETGNRPQNTIIDEPDQRAIGPPQSTKLLKLKAELIAIRSHPAMHLKANIFDLDLTGFPQFDVIVIDPPWEEYKNRVSTVSSRRPTEKLETLGYEEIRSLPIPRLSANPSFVFLWVGTEHLDHGRMLLKSWGFKRCEDVVWLKSNKNSSKYNPSHADDKSYLKRTIEHCLVGTKGEQKNDAPPTFYHPNIDTDVILTEEYEIGSLEKPPELFEIIERFCQGRRRLELFANDKMIRNGWLKIGKDIESSNFNLDTYLKYFEGPVRLDSYMGGAVTGTTPEIESLRPKDDKKQMSYD